MGSSCSARSFGGPFLCVAICAATLFCAVGARAAEVDPFMGDWQGHWELVDWYDSGPIVAQVIALGDGQYRARFLEEFTARTDPYAVLDGQVRNGKVTFSGRLDPDSTPIDGTIEVTIEQDKLTGRFQGHAGGEQVSGKIAMKKTVRQSPALGAKPPAGAIALFDGTNFDKWVRFGVRRGIIDIADALGGVDNAVAYLQTKIWSPRAQQATLRLGSDDGVKVWLNGELVHANNAHRGVTPDEDRVAVSLREGVNSLLLKVTNGPGDWGAIVRFMGEGNRPLRNLREISPQFTADSGSDEYLRRNNGFITQWWIAGPYQEAGKGPDALFDIAFGPEKDGAEVEWKWLNANLPPDDQVQWALVDGAMEVRRGAGNIVTKDKFKDFRLHVEFRTPFMPNARGQGRGNSGVYLQGRYEVQVLDSYGLEGRDNECGGIYQIAAPLVNMCLPPMQWQTYDITFRAPRFDEDGNKTEDAIVTVVHNGVTVHDRVRLPRPTGGAIDHNIGEPGGIFLQDHGDPVQFRNIWLVEQ